MRIFVQAVTVVALLAFLGQSAVAADWSFCGAATAPGKPAEFEIEFTMFTEANITQFLASAKDNGFSTKVQRIESSGEKARWVVVATLESLPPAGNVTKRLDAVLSAIPPAAQKYSCSVRQSVKTQ
ncbi:hypothetical protein [Roseateles albus]|uniref:SPOR domain-containing protein n=1 Tax=Roseateles albus TaxID=2987525 RepID=A0ABT5KCQ2_9BURK|nr:hypothetical protein [Roseateles albus]MDC8771718.1 hypothetical protein [Roseateles albus]